MTKILLTIIALFSLQAVSFGYNYYNYYSNPAHPLHIMNPANPVSPLNPINKGRHANYVRKTHNKEEYTYKVYRMYEICYKDSCRQTTSRELKHTIYTCLKHNGGSACLYKVIE
jgi:hypothetical protein